MELKDQLLEEMEFGNEGRGDIHATECALAAFVFSGSAVLAAALTLWIGGYLCR